MRSIDSDLLHTRIGALGLVLGGLTFGVGDLVRRSLEPAAPTPSTLTATAHDHAGAWLLAALLVLSASFLLIPGAVAVSRWVRGRGELLTTIGTYLLGIGMVCSALHVAGYYGLYGTFAGSGLPDTAIAAIDTQSEQYPLFVLGIVGFVIGTMLGTILLAIGLRRAHRVPIWLPVAAIVFVVAGTVAGVPAGVVGLLAALASFSTIGALMLRSLTTTIPVVPEPAAVGG